MYNLSEIQDGIRMYKLKQILISGENDMFDNKIDRKAVEECLVAENEKNENDNDKLKIGQMLLNAKDDELLKSIINLKDSHVEWKYKFGN